MTPDIGADYLPGMKPTTGQRIKALRKKRKLTQVELAQAGDFSQAVLSEWEADKRPPSRRLLARLAAALKVKPQRLVG